MESGGTLAIGDDYPATGSATGYVLIDYTVGAGVRLNSSPTVTSIRVDGDSLVLSAGGAYRDGP